MRPVYVRDRMRGPSGPPTPRASLVARSPRRWPTWRGSAVVSQTLADQPLAGSRGRANGATTLVDEASCVHGASALSGALEEAGIEDVEGLTLDTELRAALEVYGLANDAALCAADRTDAANTELPAEQPSIDDNEELRRGCFGHEPAPSRKCRAHQLRIARLAEDGRIELGVELADGEQILPACATRPSTLRRMTGGSAAPSRLTGIRSGRLARGAWPMAESSWASSDPMARGPLPISATAGGHLPAGVGSAAGRSRCRRRRC